MHLNRRHTDRCDRIPNRHAGMGIGCRINQQTMMRPRHSLDRINQMAFMIRLEGIEGYTFIFSQLLKLSIYIL